MNNVLSVIVPVYNDAANIGRCLSSLINQTFKKMEIIVVNDASTDNTLDVLHEYQKMHHFRIINMTKNSGAGCCRNAGILAANTDYVTFVDSDDWIDISTYFNCAEQIAANTDVVIFGLIYDYVMQNRREVKYYYSKNYKMPGEFALNIYAHTIPNEISITPIVNNKVYRRQFLLENNLLFASNIRYQEDDLFTFKVLAKASSVAFVPDCFYHYCQRSDSLIHTVSEVSVRSFIAAYMTLEADLKSDFLFEKYKYAFYLKFKGSLLGVIKRIIDYEHDATNRNKLIYLLLDLLIRNCNIPEILNTFDFLALRSIL